MKELTNAQQELLRVFEYLDSTGVLPYRLAEMYVEMVPHLSEAHCKELLKSVQEKMIVPRELLNPTLQ